jgi:hypothetical protein
MNLHLLWDPGGCRRRVCKHSPQNPGLATARPREQRESVSDKMPVKRLTCLKPSWDELSFQHKTKLKEKPIREL